MELTALMDQILATWKRHNEILLYLLSEIPTEGLTAKPHGSKGRDVARQFTHMSRNRRGWLHFHKTGERPKLERFHEGLPPKKSFLKAEIGKTGREVEEYIKSAIKGNAKPRMFGKNIVRWMGYLISHESHHRGQIMLALKQSGFKLTEQVAIQGLWGKWISGQ